jgi:hypothetical protein
MFDEVLMKFGCFNFFMVSIFSVNNFLSFNDVKADDFDSNCFYSREFENFCDSNMDYIKEISDIKIEKNNKISSIQKKYRLKCLFRKNFKKVVTFLTGLGVFATGLYLSLKWFPEKYIEGKEKIGGRVKIDKNNFNDDQKNLYILPIGNSSQNCSLLPSFNKTENNFNGQKSLAEIALLNEKNKRNMPESLMLGSIISILSNGCFAGLATSFMDMFLSDVTYGNCYEEQIESIEIKEVCDAYNEKLCELKIKYFQLYMSIRDNKK